MYGSKLPILIGVIQQKGAVDRVQHPSMLKNCTFYVNVTSNILKPVSDIHMLIFAGEFIDAFEMHQE